MFAGFDPAAVARFDRRRIERLLGDPGIVRNRLKVESTVSNARAFLELQAEEGSFDAWIRGHVDAPPRRTSARKPTDLPAKTELSDSLSKELKGRGFRFVGSTICYAFLQATGLVNDHTVGCFRRDQV